MENVVVNTGTIKAPLNPQAPLLDNQKIKHFFVLMMENRSYDHFLGFSAISGNDAQTGKPTTAAGLAGHESEAHRVQTGTTVNLPKPGAPDTSIKLKQQGAGPPGGPSQVPVYTSYVYTVSPTAGDITDYQGNPPKGIDPQHQFPDVMMQLCNQLLIGSGLNGAPYLQVTNDGHVASYALSGNANNPGEVMLCFSKQTLPVLNALASEFVVCDQWFSSMPGPTEPNRMFAHAATSDVWDDSPSDHDYELIFGEKIIGVGETGRIFGISFPNGTIFDRMRTANVPFRIYTGDGQPQVGLLSGISIYSDIDSFDNFAADINDPNYDAAYTFLEPRYDTIAEQLGRPFINNSQHSANSVVLGEELIKTVYEAIRNSPHWNESMLVITWDEHGGFYDHVAPPKATPTGAKGQKYGFIFDQYGPRVPAVVISPWCPKGVIEHRHLEHAVIPATVEQLFNLQPLTVRDRTLAGLQTLATLNAPREVEVLTLTPVAAPNPSGPVTPSAVDPPPSTGTKTSGGTTTKPVTLPPAEKVATLEVAATAPHLVAATSPAAAVPSLAGKAESGALATGKILTGPILTQGKPADLSTPLSSISDPWLAAAVAVTVKAHIEAVPASAPTIVARMSSLKTLGDLAQYYDEAAPIIQSAQTVARVQKVAARK